MHHLQNSFQITELDGKKTNNQTPFRCVVRIKTSTYQTSRGFSLRKDVSLLKRQSLNYGLDFIHDKCSMVDPTDFVSLWEPEIETLEDGIYELIPIFSSGGYFDPYDVELVRVTVTKLEN